MRSQKRQMIGSKFAILNQRCTRAVSNNGNSGNDGGQGESEPRNLRLAHGASVLKAQLLKLCDVLLFSDTKQTKVGTSAASSPHLEGFL